MLADGIAEIIALTDRHRGAADPLQEGVEQARKWFRTLYLEWGSLRRTEEGGFETRFVDGPGGPLQLRLYQPAEPAAGNILYVHGGGATVGDLDTHHRPMRELAAMAGCTVIGIDYRLAPEHPCPAAVDDVAFVASLAARGLLEGGARPWAIAGDSAGAHLALLCLLRRRDRWYTGQREIEASSAALFYGTYARDFSTASHRRFGDGRYGLSTARMRRYWQLFTGSDLPLRHPAEEPLFADLSGLPPLDIVAAELDPLRDDSYLLAASARNAGIAATLSLVPGVIHAFLQMTASVPLARATLMRSAVRLRSAFI